MCEIGASPLIRCVSCEAFEHRGKMSLGLESDRQSDFHDGNFGLLEQLFSAFDPPLQQIFMRPHADRRPELRSKVHPAEPGDQSKVLKCELCGQVIVHIL